MIGATPATPLAADRPVADRATHEQAVGDPRAGRRHERWIVLAAFALAALTCLLGEKIDINDGLGWDGAAYGQIARDPFAFIEQRALLAVTIHRIAPPMIAHLLLRPFFWPVEYPQIIRLFIVADVLGITLATWLVIRTLDALGAGPRTKWFAFAGLTLNFGIGKWFPYYPVITDMPGFVLGATLIYAFVRRNLPLLYVATFLAGFTWPGAHYEGLILTIWAPFRSDAPPAEARHWLIRGLALGGSAAIALAFAGWSFYLLEPTRYAAIPYNVHEPMYGVLWLSIALGAAYLFFGFWNLTRYGLPSILRALPRLVIHWNTWLAVLLLYGLVQWIVGRLSAADTALELDVYPHMVMTSIVQPGVFLLSHAVFYGPIVVLAALAWPRIGRTAARLGPGVTLATGVMLLLAIGSESRREFNFLPLLVVLTVLSLDLERWSWRMVAALGVLCAVTSKLWLPIGPLGDPNNLTPRLFMNLGPWMELDAYLWQLGGLVVVTALLWMMLRSGRADQQGAAG